MYHSPTTISIQNKIAATVSGTSHISPQIENHYILTIYLMRLLTELEIELPVRDSLVPDNKLNSRN